MSSEGKTDWNSWAKKNTDPEKASEKPEALAGITALDLSNGNFAGLFASSLLSELGARVIRLEPIEGDIARKMTPAGKTLHGTGLPYLVEARNKEHATLNIKKPAGREILKEMVKVADVLIETFYPGFMNEIGLGWKVLKELNPRLVYVAINTFGQSGELAAEARVSRWKSYDVIAQALSGLAFITGIPEDREELPQHVRVPTKLGNWMGSYAGGAFAALSAMAALLFRESSGEGQFIDVNPAEALMNYGYPVQLYHLTHSIVQRAGNIDPAAHPNCYVRCKDGMLLIAAYTDIDWKALCTVLGREDLAEKYPTVQDRTDTHNAVEILREIEKFTLDKMRSEVVALLDSYKGPGEPGAAAVLLPEETVKLCHWFERKALVNVKEEPWGDLLIQGTAAKMSETPPRLKWVCREVGADNERVYFDLLKFDKDKLKELRDKELI